MREETGMSAAKLEKIGEFFLAPGYSTEFMHVYLATGLSPAPLQPDEDEFLSIERLPVAEVYARIESGGFRDGKTLAALLLARPFLTRWIDSA
jgi:ADP-ribose pyrophosphatase